MKVNVINTGGTISCVGDPLAPMSASQFAQACQQNLNPIIQQQYPGVQLNYVTDLTFPESTSGTLDSTNLQPTDWCLIAGYILNHYAECDGWVVLHGTDSMDFTGTALPFLLSSFSSQGIPTAVLSKPVIITGSQVPMFYQDTKGACSLRYNTDAFQNFCGAIAAAQSGVPEVCIYFDSQLFRANRCVKTNASEFNAFSSPNYPALGQYGIAFQLNPEEMLPPPVSNNVSLDNPTVLGQAIAQLNYVTQNINSFPVMQFNAFPAWYSTGSTPSGLIASLITACVGQGIKGLVLESYGEGNFPSGNPDNPPQGSIYQALQKANASDVVIVDCTQVLQGVVNDNAYAAGAWLPAVGALNPADMTPMAALAKLMVLLSSAGYSGNDWGLSDVKRLFQLDLLGEMMSVSRLDSRTHPTLLTGQTLTALDGSATLTNDPVAGPVLTKSDGSVLWTALSSPAAQLPGRLIMQNDGNLVFYNRENVALWATNTGVSSGASSMLILGGSASDGTLTLTVYDYSHGKTTQTLYPSSTAVHGQPQPKETSMSTPRKQFKFSGRIAPQDPLHQFTLAKTLDAAPDEHYIAPTTVNVNIVSPEPRTIGVPQYGPTVNGGNPSGFNPAGDCQGNFMSYKFQANNNCYAYGCNITPNTFPQPGRQSGYLLTASEFAQPFDTLGALVASYAEKDGLVFAGKSMDELMKFKSSKQGTNPGGGLKAGALNGHFVALMISPAGDANWPGDYHWARCDNSSGGCDSWSQKDGPDQVTNFDFAGNVITNPATANWTVNQGPIASGSPDAGDDQVVDYAFYCFMFVPTSGVNII
ncbi:asparaginase domain-containing protein [Archangium sp.]|uniref:asparaginase domain-containing protein n=1 Tax=Archangium sp. TaxID=1872627 RepID=UPI00389A7752